MTSYRSIYFFFIGCALALTMPSQALENTRAIEQQVAKFLEQEYQQSAKKLTIQVGRLDPRLRLAACEEPLQMNLRDPDHSGGSISVQVSCALPQPWAIYTSAQVDLYHEILVARRAIGRGEILNESNVEQKQVNISLQRQGYLIDLQSLEGQVAKRNIRPGETLRQGLLEAPLAISRGQTVSLASRSGGITVVTQAEALGNGRVGEQVRVRNLSSERIISARIIEEGAVEVVF